MERKSEGLHTCMSVCTVIYYVINFDIRVWSAWGVIWQCCNTNLRIHRVVAFPSAAVSKFVLKDEKQNFISRVHALTSIRFVYLNLIKCLWIHDFLSSFLLLKSHIFFPHLIFKIFHLHEIWMNIEFRLYVGWFFMPIDNEIIRFSDQKFKLLPLESENLYNVDQNRDHWH